MAAGGNGNPNKLPGLGAGVRQKVGGAMLERNHSVGSASVGRVSQVNYVDMPQNMGGGSSSLILDADDNVRPGHQARVSEISMPEQSYINSTQDRLKGRDSNSGLIRSNDPAFKKKKINDNRN